ncbi:MAG: LysM peptidoglycan-binding domain-containing protein [Lapillicoccus sp.]
MHQRERGSTALVRGSALAALSLAAALAAARVFTAAAEPSWERVTGPGPGDPADVLMVLVAGLGTLLSAWLAVATVAAVLTAVPGAAGRVAGSVAWRLAPPALWRGVSLLLGMTLTAGGVPAAAAADTGPPGCRPASSGPLVPGPDPGFRPLVAAPTGPCPVLGPDPGFRPLVAAPAGPSPVLGPAFPPAQPPPVPRGAQDLGALERPPRAGTTAGDSVVVRRGDTLWDISARHLGGDTTAAEIAREWPRWYDANRAVIGAHPDLIQPGQRLAPPARWGPR